MSNVKNLERMVSLTWFIAAVSMLIGVAISMTALSHIYGYNFFVPGKDSSYSLALTGVHAECMYKTNEDDIYKEEYSKCIETNAREYSKKMYVLSLSGGAIRCGVKHNDEQERDACLNEIMAKRNILIQMDK